MKLTKEFNLSDKRIKRNFSETYMYDEKNVKEFIRLLKEELGNIVTSHINEDGTHIETGNHIIDKLAGEKLK